MDSINVKDEVLARIAKPFNYTWRAHGLGMLRTYLDIDETIRLNLWHHRLIVPDVSLMHTHPWTLQSSIIAGVLRNTRWDRVEAHAKGSKLFWEDKVPCGLRAVHEFALAGNPQEVWLRPREAEVYGPGEMYSQEPSEIHTTDFDNGTATVMRRGTDRTEGEEASVFWPHADKWGDATREATTEDIVETISAVRAQLGSGKVS